MTRAQGLTTTFIGGILTSASPCVLIVFNTVAPGTELTGVLHRKDASP